VVLLLFAVSACRATTPTSTPDQIPTPTLQIVTQAVTPSPSLTFTRITDNQSDYPEGEIPAYSLYEMTFQAEGSVAANPYFPYDPDPPPGINTENPAYQGISIDALFTPDDWQTIYRTPAFYNQEFEHQIVQVGKQDREWIYPTENYAWYVRFSPPTPGNWKVRLEAVDASGVATSEVISFTVVNSKSAGFVQVSSTDRRYFVTEHGGYFPGLGINLSSGVATDRSPTLDNQALFEALGQNGIQVARVWLSQWGVYGSAWNPWNSIVPGDGDRFIPFEALTTANPYTPVGSETSMVINARRNPCMFVGWLKPAPAVKPNTTYHIRVRYRLENLEGLLQTDLPGGLVVKTGDWLWDEQDKCGEAGVGQAVSPYADEAPAESADPWQILEGTWESENNFFLPYFYLVMENLSRGRAIIDYVWIQEDVGDGELGPNILNRPWMSHHLYIDQRQAYAFDKLLELAATNGIYLRPILLEKGDWVMTRLAPDGSFQEDSPDPVYFYGSGRKATKTRWLQQAWWRYAQARWGYSPSIHSWELLNEGNPDDGRHYLLADEFGKFMHCTVFGAAVPFGDGQLCTAEHPNAHLVSTSLWSGFPAQAFWANPAYPNLDFADVHAYVSTGWLQDQDLSSDAAAYHLAYSSEVRSRLEKNLPDGRLDSRNMPVVRGEAGLDFPNRQEEQPDLTKDTAGVWLHNLLWATLDEGALHETYWWTSNLLNQPGPDEEPGLYEVFGHLADFLAGVPLDNGYFQKAEVTVNNPSLRVVGQTDSANGWGVIWVQNPRHTWLNVVNGETDLSGVSGSLYIAGFSAGATLQIEWVLFTTNGLPQMENSAVQVGEDGVLMLELPDALDITDAAIKIYP
jgi:hypothetical protein